jgi:hypothetical protein
LSAAFIRFTYPLDPAEPKRLVFNPGDLGIEFQRVYGTILITKVLYSP